MAHHQHFIGLTKITFVLFLHNQIISTIDTFYFIQWISSSQQHGQEGKDIIFYDNPDQIIWVQPAPLWSRCSAHG